METEITGIINRPYKSFERIVEQYGSGRVIIVRNLRGMPIFEFAWFIILISNNRMFDFTVKLNQDENIKKIVQDKIRLLNWWGSEEADIALERIYYFQDIFDRMPQESTATPEQDPEKAATQTIESPDLTEAKNLQETNTSEVIEPQASKGADTGALPLNNHLEKLTEGDTPILRKWHGGKYLCRSLPVFIKAYINDVDDLTPTIIRDYLLQEKTKKPFTNGTIGQQMKLYGSGRRSGIK